MAVEVNLELVPRQRHAEHRLAEGDRLEIVTPSRRRLGHDGHKAAAAGRAAVKSRKLSRRLRYESAPTRLPAA